MKTFEHMIGIVAPADQVTKDGIGVLRCTMVAMAATNDAAVNAPELDPEELVTAVLVGFSGFAKLGGVSDDDLRGALENAIKIRDAIDAHSEALARTRKRASS